MQKARTEFSAQSPASGFPYKWTCLCYYRPLCKQTIENENQFQLQQELTYCVTVVCFKLALVDLWGFAETLKWVRVRAMMSCGDQKNWSKNCFFPSVGLWQRYVSDKAALAAVFIGSELSSLIRLACFSSWTWSSVKDQQATAQWFLTQKQNRCLLLQHGPPHGCLSSGLLYFWNAFAFITLPNTEKTPTNPESLMTPSYRPSGDSHFNSSGSSLRFHRLAGKA